MTLAECRFRSENTIQPEVSYGTENYSRYGSRQRQSRARYDEGPL